jgi:hypothetical protein
MEESLDVFSAFNGQEAHLQWKEALSQEKRSSERQPAAAWR